MAATAMAAKVSLGSSLVGSKSLSSSAAVQGRRVAPTVNVSRTVCSAENRSAAKLAAAALAASVALAAPQIASADVAGLTPCKDSAAYAKVQKKEVRKLEKRLALYEPGSAPALAIQATIDRTKARFDSYGNLGLLCGTDGLPHLIVDGDLNHLSEFVYPGLAFLYIAGWIGWVGREYLNKTKSIDKEIIIDVPLGSSLLWRGLVWPVTAGIALRKGTLLEKAENITISPR